MPDPDADRTEPAVLPTTRKIGFNGPIAPRTNTDLPDQKHKGFTMNEQAPKKSMSGCAKAGIGCGIALVIVLIIAAIGGWLLWKNARSIAAAGAAYVVNQAIEQSSLPTDQKQVISSRVDQIKKQFASGDLTLEEITQGLEQVNIQGLIAAGVTQTVGSGMIESSQLSDNNKAIGHMALNRITQGVMDGQIDIEKVGQVLAPIRQDPNSENWQFKANPTAEELQQVVDNANDLADQSGVPAEVPEVDFAQRVDEAFDEVFGPQ